MSIACTVNFPKVTREKKSNSVSFNVSEVISLIYQISTFNSCVMIARISEHWSNFFTSSSEYIPQLTWKIRRHYNTIFFSTTILILEKCWYFLSARSCIVSRFFSFQSIFKLKRKRLQLFYTWKFDLARKKNCEDMFFQTKFFK